MRNDYTDPANRCPSSAHLEILLRSPPVIALSKRTNYRHHRSHIKMCIAHLRSRCSAACLRVYTTRTQHANRKRQTTIPGDNRLARKRVNHLTAVIVAREIRDFACAGHHHSLKTGQRIICAVRCSLLRARNSRTLVANQAREC